MKKLNMFTYVWGDTHISWMERSLIRSLCWPQNKQALKNATWHMWAKKSEQDHLFKLVDRVGVAKLAFHELPEYLNGTPPEMGLIMLRGLIEMMEHCVAKNEQLLTAPPDTFFSEGSIQAMIKMARFGDTCVAVPHARVSPSIFGSVLNDDPLTGADLVDRLFKHQHKAWSLAEIGHEYQNTFIGGIAWQKLSDKIWGVQHMLPTIYLANFVASDVTFFKTPQENEPPVYGYWDHLWPRKLVEEQRQRVPGSSDVACLLEVTKEDRNIPARVQVNPLEPDAFWRGALHNKHNRQNVYVMRGN